MTMVTFVTFVKFVTFFIIVIFRTILWIIAVEITLIWALKI